MQSQHAANRDRPARAFYPPHGAVGPRYDFLACFRVKDVEECACTGLWWGKCDINQHFFAAANMQYVYVRGRVVIHTMVYCFHNGRTLLFHILRQNVGDWFGENYQRLFSSEVTILLNMQFGVKWTKKGRRDSFIFQFFENKQWWMIGWWFQQA